MQELSIGELDALVLKAFRGAGYSWGLSQEAGRAATWLAIRGLPSADLFGYYLDQINGVAPERLAPGGINCDELRREYPCCPIQTGAQISDFGCSTGNQVKTGRIYSPMIMLPFVASCAKVATMNLSLRISEVEIWLNSDGELTSTVEVTDQLFNLRHAPDMTISAVDHVDGTRLTAKSRRAPVSDSHLHTLETLAHLTYVPASDQSRGGAGAGFNDND